MKTGHTLIDNSTAPFVAGSDECGYGAWAGKLTVTVVLVLRDWVPPVGLTDSKKMSRTAMQRVRDAFLAGPWTWYEIGWADVEEIDRLGVYAALYGLHASLMRKAAAVAQEFGGEVLRIVDGDVAVEGCIALPKADMLVPAVSMASVLGKLARDEYMEAMDADYPGYGFRNHVGYGVPAHQEALQRLGPCAIHRRSYAPIAALVRSQEEPREAWAGFEDEPNPVGA